MAANTPTTTPHPRVDTAGNQPRVDVSVVMPCLNEATTLAACIARAFEGLAAGDLSGEVIVADNGSTDGSPDIAERSGARVVDVSEKGYGAALLGGIAAARGHYVAMADADGSYDFGEIPNLITKLNEGYDLVLGNRFAGGIKPGDMPWHHRYIGNPLLSGLGRLLYRPGCRDFHCGLRAFDRERINQLHLNSSGMEFASEMVLRAAQAKLRITELPIVLHPDGRQRPPHLRSFRDGWRHLKLLLTRWRSQHRSQADGWSATSQPYTCDPSPPALNRRRKVRSQDQPLSNR
jgi:glycosyltransferase involved in cell wall biosynthesis